MEAKAVAKYVRMSPIKLKPVTDLVRGKDLNEALNILKFTPGKGSEIVEKVVKSAAANAENNFDMEGPIDVSNVMYYDDKAKEPVKLGYEIKDGKKVRISKKTGNVID